MPATQRTEYRANSTVYLETRRGFDVPLPAAAFQAFQIGYSTGGGAHHAGPVVSALNADLGRRLIGLWVQNITLIGMFNTCPNAAKTAITLRRTGGRQRAVGRGLEGIPAPNCRCDQQCRQADD